MREDKAIHKVRGRVRNSLKREDNDEETIKDQRKRELELARCVYRSQMSGGNCAVGLLCTHLAAESSVFFRTDTQTPTNLSEELHIIPLEALLRACNLGSFISFRFPL